MDGSMDEWMEACKGSMDGCMDESMDGWNDGRICGWLVDAWMGWMDGCVSEVDGWNQGLNAWMPGINFAHVSMG